MNRRQLGAMCLTVPAALLLISRKAFAMTKTQMQSLVTAITNAGFPAEIRTPDGGATWRVVSRTTTGTSDVNVNTVKTLADAQGVSAFVAEVEYR
jgi:hypothetical protein